MRILFVGASSFTGMHFVKKLCESGHEVLATTTRSSVSEYPAEVRLRLDQLTTKVSLYHGVRFGGKALLDLVAKESPDLLCLHGAQVGDHVSPDFDFQQAYLENTRGCRNLFELLAAKGVAVVVTGSYFEADEGAGGPDLRAFSPYALSKTLSWQTYCFEAQRTGMALGKYTLCNPFGSYEKKGLNSYLIKAWLSGSIPEIHKPALKRDFAPIGLLSRDYALFCQHLAVLRSGIHRRNPSCFTETVKDFAGRLACQLGKRNGKSYLVSSKPLDYLGEPMERWNTDKLLNDGEEWNWEAEWEDYFKFYEEKK